MARFKKIMITGAAGNLGRQLREHLAQFADERVLMDRAEMAAAGAGETVVQCDLTEADVIAEHMEGVDVVVHFGGAPLEHTFETILNSNIVGSYNIYEGARKAGVKRVVYASSIHAVGYHQRESVIDTDCDHRPDSMYGVSKCFVEDLARYYFDKYGIESVCLRINSSFPEPLDRRMLGTWLSYRDCCKLVERSILAPRVGFTVAYGISDNDEAFVSNHLVKHLGYRPQDNAEIYREKVEAATEPGDAEDPAIKFIGGSFCAAGHYEDKD